MWTRADRQIWETQLCELIDWLLDARGSFNRSIQQLMIHLEEDDIPSYVETLTIWRKENYRDVRFQTMIRRLLCSQSDLWNADVHPIGAQVSVDLQCDGLQNLLNVKRIKVDNVAKKAAAAEKGQQQQHRPIQPNIELTRLYAHPTMQWIRVRLADHVTDSMARQLVPSTMPRLERFYAYCCPLGAPHLWEYYFLRRADNRVLLQPLVLLGFFQAATEVERIVFISNCKTLKRQLIDQDMYLVFSNIFKFYYCTLTQNIDFVIRPGKANMDLIISIYIFATVLVHKSNLKMFLDVDNRSNPMAKGTPLTALSGYSPQQLVHKCVHLMEPLNEGDTVPVEQHRRAGTPYSATSENTGLKHCVYTLSTDRDRRLMNLSSIVGGNNSHVVTFHNVRLSK